MTHVITSACVCVKDQSCVAACPVDCILGEASDPMLFIDPALCIDCGACIPVCPAKAIVHERDVPKPEEPFAAINRLYFEDRPTALRMLQQAPAARNRAAEPAIPSNPA